MARKISIGEDLYDEDAIAFVRKLGKPTKGLAAPNGGTLPSKHYLVQLKLGYDLNGHGLNRIWLGKEGGERVLRQLQEGPQEGPPHGPTR